MPDKPTPRAQPNNPLHGLTLQTMIKHLVDYHGWEGLAAQIPVRCFTHEPSVKSSLAFLRKTPWARDKVEQFYLITWRATRGDAQD